MKKVVSFLFFFAQVVFFFAQTNPPQIKWDTNYYKKYNNRLVVSLYSSRRVYDIQFDTAVSNSKPVNDFFADANIVSGIEIDYDKFSVSLGYKTTPPDNVLKKGKTTCSNWSFSFGGNKWTLETAYRKYKGFYDSNTALYDTTYTDSTAYYQNPSMTNRSIKAKIFYFFNHKKFAYKSAYTCVYRQLKTRASFLVVGNFYQNKLDADTSFFPELTKNMYGVYSDLNGLRVIGLSGGGGVSVNLVAFKRFFINGTFAIGPELQLRKYTHYSGLVENKTSVAGVADWRFSIGMNLKNFFITGFVVYDIVSYKNKAIDISSTFFSGYGTIGYRFKFKTPKLYQKFQDTKFYEMM